MECQHECQRRTKPRESVTSRVPGIYMCCPLEKKPQHEANRGKRGDTVCSSMDPVENVSSVVSPRPINYKRSQPVEPAL
jgi:hypothetical protein